MTLLSPDATLDAILASSASTIRPSYRATSEQSALRIINSALYAKSINRFFNLSLTVTYRGASAGDDARASIKVAIRKFLARRAEDGAPSFIYVEENAAGGGQGVHSHWLIHLPPDDFQRHAADLERILALSYRDHLVALAKAQGIKVYSRSLAIDLYRELLLKRRSAAEAERQAENLLTLNADRTQDARLITEASEAREVSSRISLPFFISYPKGRENLPLEADYVMERQLPYLLKSVDPTIQVRDRHGSPTTIGAMNRETGGDVSLQAQSRNRPARAMAIGKVIGEQAMERAGWSPVRGIENYLSASVMQMRRRAVVMDFLTRAKSLTPAPVRLDPSHHSVSQEIGKMLDRKTSIQESTISNYTVFGYNNGVEEVDTDMTTKASKPKRGPLLVMDARDYSRLSEDFFRAFIMTNRAAGTLRLSFSGEEDKTPGFYKWVMNLAQGTGADGTEWIAQWEAGASVIMMCPALDAGKAPNLPETSPA